MVSDESGLSASYIEENEEQKGNLLSEVNHRYFQNLTNDDYLFLAESDAIKKLAKKGSCVIIGRCADVILKDEKNVFRIFLYSDLNHKIERAKKYYGLDKDVSNKITKINQARKRHYEYYTGLKWEDASHYDLCLNVDFLGVEKTAEFIEGMLKERI